MDKVNKNFNTKCQVSSVLVNEMMKTTIAVDCLVPTGKQAWVEVETLVEIQTGIELIAGFCLQQKPSVI